MWCRWRCVGSLHPGTHVTPGPHVLEPKPYQLHSCHRARCHTQFKTQHQNQRWLPRHRKITTPHERGDEATVGRGSSMYNVYLYIYCRFCLGGEGYIKPPPKREGWIFIPFFKDFEASNYYVANCSFVAVNTLHLTCSYVAVNRWILENPGAAWSNSSFPCECCIFWPYLKIKINIVSNGLSRLLDFLEYLESRVCFSHFSELDICFTRWFSIFEQFIIPIGF